jgi:outer membrane lipoprotein-sorting protein
MMTFRMAALALAAFCISGAARADDCTAAMAALRAGVQKPYSTTITMAGFKGMTDYTSRVVMTGTKMYIETHGKWSTVPMTSKQIIATMDDQAKTATTTCHRTGDGSVGGEATAVYSMHVVNKGLTSDTMIWVSKASGLPAKSQLRMAGGQTITSLFDYVHVQPPAGIK